MVDQYYISNEGVLYLSFDEFSSLAHQSDLSSLLTADTVVEDDSVPILVKLDDAKGDLILQDVYLGGVISNGESQITIHSIQFSNSTGSTWCSLFFKNVTFDGIDNVKVTGNIITLDEVYGANISVIASKFKMLNGAADTVKADISGDTFIYNGHSGRVDITSSNVDISGTFNFLNVTTNGAIKFHNDTIVDSCTLFGNIISNEGTIAIDVDSTIIAQNFSNNGVIIASSLQYNGLQFRNLKVLSVTNKLGINASLELEPYSRIHAGYTIIKGDKLRCVGCTFIMYEEVESSVQIQSFTLINDISGARGEIILKHNIDLQVQDFVLENSILDVGGSILFNISRSFKFNESVKAIKGLLCANSISGKIALLTFGFVDQVRAVADANRAESFLKIANNKQDKIKSIATIGLNVSRQYQSYTTSLSNDMSSSFAQDGDDCVIDINLLINAYEFGNTFIVDKNVYDSLSYYIKLIGNVDSVFDPVNFLQKVKFDGQAYTTDGHYTAKLIRDVIYKITGILDVRDSAYLPNILAYNGYLAQSQLSLIAGQTLTKDQRLQLQSPIIWPVWSSHCGYIVPTCLSYKLYYNKSKLLYGGYIFTTSDIKLELNALISKHLTTFESERGMIDLKISDNFIAYSNFKLVGSSINIVTGQKFGVAGDMSSTGNLRIQAKDALIVGTITGDSLSLQTSGAFVLRSVVSDNAWRHNRYNYGKDIRLLYQAALSFTGLVSVRASNNLQVSGAEIKSKHLLLSSEYGSVIVDSIPLHHYRYTREKSGRYRTTGEDRVDDYHQSSIVTTDTKNNISDVRISLASSVHQGIAVFAKADIVFNGVNVNTSSNILINSKAGNIDIITPIRSAEYTYRHFKKCFLLSCIAYDRKEIGSSRRSSSSSVSAKVTANTISLVGIKKINIGYDLSAQSIKIHNIADEKSEAGITIIPQISRNSYEVRTHDSGFLFERVEGKFLIHGSKHSTKTSSQDRVRPTLLQIGGLSDDPNDEPMFAAYSSGKFIVVSSTIEKSADDVSGKTKIIIEASDIELESMPDVDLDFIAVDYAGVGIGFKCNTQEVSLTLGLHILEDIDKLKKTKHNNVSKFAADEITLKADSIKDKGAIYMAKKMQMHAKVIVHGVVTDVVEAQSHKKRISEGVQLGAQFGVIGDLLSIANEVSALPDEGEGKLEWAMNTGIQAYRAYRDVLKATAGKFMPSAGLAYGATINEGSSSSKYVTQTGSQINAAELNIETDDLTLVGTQISAYASYIQSKKLQIEAAESFSVNSEHHYNAEVFIPLTFGASMNLLLGGGKIDGEDLKKFKALVYVTDNLKIEVAGHADISGASINANILEASFDSLLLASASDIAKEKGWDLSVAIGSGFGVSAGKVENGKSVIREITELLGFEKCDIIVANALRLNGAMIASAERDKDGKLTEHGQLTVKVGELFVEHIHQYDEGLTLAASLSKAALLPEFAGHKSYGDLFATIGQGELELTCGLDEEPGCGSADLHRDVGNYNDMKSVYNIKRIKLYVPFEKAESLPRTAEGKIDFIQIKDNIRNDFLSSIKNAFRWRDHSNSADEVIEDGDYAKEEDVQKNDKNDAKETEDANIAKTLDELEKLKSKVKKDDQKLIEDLKNDIKDIHAQDVANQASDASRHNRKTAIEEVALQDELMKAVASKIHHAVEGLRVLSAKYPILAKSLLYGFSVVSIAGRGIGGLVQYGMQYVKGSALQEISGDEFIKCQNLVIDAVQGAIIKHFPIVTQEEAEDVAIVTLYLASGIIGDPRTANFFAKKATSRSSYAKQQHRTSFEKRAHSQTGGTDKASNAGNSKTNPSGADKTSNAKTNVGQKQTTQQFNDEKYNSWLSKTNKNDVQLHHVFSNKGESEYVIKQHKIFGDDYLGKKILDDKRNMMYLPKKEGLHPDMNVHAGGRHTPEYHKRIKEQLTEAFNEYKDHPNAKVEMEKKFWRLVDEEKGRLFNGESNIYKKRD